MRPSEWFESLRTIDAGDLDLNNPGSWPAVVKAMVGGLLMVLLLALGYNLYLKESLTRLGRESVQEAALKAQFEAKAHLAANLELYAAQMNEVESALGVLLRQLPGDTEVPGLLEDISRTASDSGLTFEKIRLLPPVTQSFYIELPIQIRVSGTYHGLGAFVSGIAGLPRIVTLHDFEIVPAAQSGYSQLHMGILAKTYRYNGQGVGK
jgi:type IV pilus assembly protein PilO